MELLLLERVQQRAARTTEEMGHLFCIVRWDGHKLYEQDDASSESVIEMETKPSNLRC